MSRCWQVGQDLWLGLARCTRWRGEAPGRRWQNDRDAADQAVAAVVAASGLGPDSCATSRSHTQGVAAAVAAPPGMRVGVDLVQIDRVSRRHAEAVLSSREWASLAAYSSVRPALAWALKESAAKASGDPRRCFPHGLRIESGPAGLMVRQVADGGVTLAAGWRLFGSLLCGWVMESPHPSNRAAKLTPSP